MTQMEIVWLIISTVLIVLAIVLFFLSDEFRHRWCERIRKIAIGMLVFSIIIMIGIIIDIEISEDTKLNKSNTEVYSEENFQEELI